MKILPYKPTGLYLSQRYDDAIKARDETIARMQQEQKSIYTEQLKQLREELEKERELHKQTLHTLQHCLSDYNNKIASLQEDGAVAQNATAMQQRNKGEVPAFYDVDSQQTSLEIRPDKHMN